MPGQQKLPTRLTALTTGMAAPRSPEEIRRSMEAACSALQGTWGQGFWDGGVGGDGAWRRSSYFADLKLYYDAPGGITPVVFPWPLFNCLVRATTLSTGVTLVSYLASGSSISIDSAGPTFIEVTMASTSG